jgi:hypothetical protein
VDEVEEEDEMMLVNTVQQEGSSWRELDDLWLELNGGECGETGGVYCIGACLREGDHAPGTKGGQPHETLYLSEEEGAVEAGRWSPDPMELQPNEGETEYLISLLMGGSGAGKDEFEPARTSAAPNMQSRRTGGEEAAEEGNQPLKGNPRRQVVHRHRVQKGTTQRTGGSRQGDVQEEAACGQHRDQNWRRARRGSPGIPRGQGQYEIRSRGGRCRR